MTLTWAELAARSLARQFPSTADEQAPTGPEGVASLVERVGPMQTQTARSAYLGLGARAPGLTHAALTEAYEAHALVRGSTVRGTVHTATAAQHRLLDAATRTTQHAMYERSLQMDHGTPEDMWAEVETYAAEEWRTPEELRAHLADWLAGRGEDEAVERFAQSPGRYLAFGHGGLVRRPLKGGWEGQGLPGYRSAHRVTGLPLPEPETATHDLVRMHLRCHGPASRHDVAWWSGLGLPLVDRVLADLDLVGEEGPDGRTYLDLPEVAAEMGTRELPGVRFLPEFDALLCGYDSKRRDRFVTPEHHAALWNQTNGMILPPLLVDGRITGYWRATGSAKRRPLQVCWFAGTRKPRKAELEPAVAALETVLAITITEVTTTRV